MGKLRAIFGHGTAHFVLVEFRPVRYLPVRRRDSDATGGNFAGVAGVGKWGRRAWGLWRSIR